MDYYTRKQRAMKIVDSMAKQGEYTINAICTAVVKQYQLGKKFVFDYIDLLKENDEIAVKEDGTVFPVER